MTLHKIKHPLSGLSFKPLLLLMFFIAPVLGWAQIVEPNTATREGVTKRVDIPEADLPNAIQGNMNTKYPMAIFIEAFKYLDEEGNIHYYEVRLEREGEPALKLTYDSTGKRLDNREQHNDEEMKREENKMQKKRGNQN